MKWWQVYSEVVELVIPRNTVSSGVPAHWRRTNSVFLACLSSSHEIRLCRLQRNRRSVYNMKKNNWYDCAGCALCINLVHRSHDRNEPLSFALQLIISRNIVYELACIFHERRSSFMSSRPKCLHLYSFTVWGWLWWDYEWTKTTKVKNKFVYGKKKFQKNTQLSFWWNAKSSI